jgi:hypothetical protein
LTAVDLIKFFIVSAPIIVVVVIVFALNLAMLYPINHESLLILLSSFFHFKSNIQPSLFLIDIYDLLKLENNVIQSQDHFVAFINYICHYKISF